jgi:CTP:molybdopterin cytidylyltransferase MocA
MSGTAFDSEMDGLFAATAIVLLAAGRSSRFVDGDKLLAPLGGRPLITHSAALLGGERVGCRIAVVGPGHEARAELLRAAGWTVVVNAQAESGLASSLAVGIAQARNSPFIEAALVLLADMPDVPQTHLVALRATLGDGCMAVMSATQETLRPPAIFRREVFDQLMSLSGDAGARKVFDRLSATATVELPEPAAADVDTRADLERLGARQSVHHNLDDRQEKQDF